MMTTARGDCPYIAVPAFVSKYFRHSAIYIGNGRGIHSPNDLIGKRIGMPEYQMTACLWARGILEDEYGVRPRDIQWFTGGQEEPGRRERARLTVDKSVSITPIGPAQTLSGKPGWLHLAHGVLECRDDQSGGFRQSSVRSGNKLCIRCADDHQPNGACRQ